MPPTVLSPNPPAEGSDLTIPAPGTPVEQTANKAPDTLDNAQQERINECVQWMRWSWQAKQFHRDRWLDRHRRFRRYKDDADWGTARSRLYVPAEVFTKSITLHSYLTEALFGSTDDFFGFTPEEATDQIVADSWTKVQKKWLKENQTIPALDRGLLQYCIYGNTCFTFHWNPDKQMPESMWRDIFTVYPSPNARSVDDADYVIIREVVPNFRMKKLRDAGAFPGHEFTDDDLKGMPTEGEDNTYHAEALKRQDVGEDPQTAQSRQTFSEILEVYQDDRITFILNRKFILYDHPNGHGKKPIVIVPMVQTDDSIWGEGLGDILRDPEDAKITIHNMRIDNFALSTLPMFFVRKNAINPADFFIRPEGLIPVEGDFDKNLNDLIQQLRVNDIGQGSEVEERSLNRMSDDASGVTPMVVGATEAGVDTATEFAGLQRATGMRLKTYLRHLELNLLEQILRWNMELARTQATNDMAGVVAGMQRILGDSIPPEFIQKMLVNDIQMDVNIKTGSRYVNNREMQQHWAALVPLLIQAAPLGVVNLPLVLLHMFESFDLPDADRLVLVPKMPPQVPGQGGGGNQPQPTVTPSSNGSGDAEKLQSVMAAGPAGAMTQ